MSQHTEAESAAIAAYLAKQQPTKVATGACALKLSPKQWAEVVRGNFPPALEGTPAERALRQMERGTI